MNSLSRCRQCSSNSLRECTAHTSPRALKTRVLAALLFVILTTTEGTAQEYPFDASLYDAEEITVELTSSSTIALVGSGYAQKIQASVSYVPEEAQKITAEPKPLTTNPLVFVWSGAGPGKYSFSFTSVVNNRVQKPHITKRITYPFSSPETVTSYLVPQEISDTNAQIRNQARELVSGKTDALETIWSLAQWVQQNVDYDLNSVTAQASKPSSWVFKNREGVCDELTSLFISLSREAGIPARFVSGYAYTNLQSFPDHWGPHGWAEVWLPDTGWVPVDVTYGQVGYVDATHVIIKHSLDAKNTAVEYELLANGLTMQPGDLLTKARVLDREGEATEPLNLALRPLYEETGSASGNLIQASVENKAPYYVATEIYLATTPDTELLDSRSQGVLLPPRSTRTVSWRVQMPSFEKGFRYTVPFTAIAQLAGNASTTVSGSAEQKVYPLLPSPQSTSALLVECGSPPPLYVGENATIECVSPGNRLCANVCSKDKITIDFQATQPGAYPTVIKATSAEESGSAVVTFVVEHRPSPSVSIALPSEVTMTDNIALTFTVNTAALSDAVVTARGPHFSHDWRLDKLQSKTFELRIPATYLNAGDNTITVTVNGQDKNNDSVVKSAQSTVRLNASIWERLQLFFIHALG